MLLVKNRLLVKYLRTQKLYADFDYKGISTAHCSRFNCIVKKAIMNVLVQVFLWTMFSFLLCKYLGVELLDHRIASSLTL